MAKQKKPFHAQLQRKVRAGLFERARTGEYDHERSCGQKKRYPTKAFAKVVAKAAARRTGEPMSVYFCMTCAGFHICRRRNFKGGQE